MAYTKHRKIKPIVVRSADLPPARETEPYYVRPPHAADIWFDGESLCIGFPPNAENVRGHVVKIPLNKMELSKPLKENECKQCSKINFAPDFASTTVASNQLGWKALLDCIKARYSARDRHIKIAERGAITGYQLEQMLKTMTAKKYDNTNKRVTTLEDLGLDR